MLFSTHIDLKHSWHRLVVAALVLWVTAVADASDAQLAAAIAAVMGVVDDAVAVCWNTLFLAVVGEKNSGVSGKMHSIPTIFP